MSQGKVALKTFIDNVAVQVVERHVDNELERIFSPMVVMQMSGEEISAIASEPPNISRQREHLLERKKALEGGRGIFRRLLRGYRL
jgi:hypothetical protein